MDRPPEPNQADGPPHTTVGHTAAGPQSRQNVRGWGANLRESLTPRTLVLILGVLALQLGFILSYVVGAAVTLAKSRRRRGTHEDAVAITLAHDV